MRPQIENTESPTLEFQAANFLGGMNFFDESTTLKEDEYIILFNGRSRFNQIRPNKLPLKDLSLPQHSNYQGVYAAGSILVVFIDGKAYYKDLNNFSAVWNPVVGFQMDPAVSRIYTCLVDASTLNYARVPISATDRNTLVSYGSLINGTPRALVCQDGINQPFIIFSDGTSRVTQNYTEWNLAGNREYVPIGTLMVYIDGVLYIIGKDSKGNYTLILRSVTGRPLDFMINILPNTGDKEASEVLGGAITVSHSVGYDDITCIGAVSTGIDGSFYVGTKNASYLLIPDLNTLIFGEPLTYQNIYLFSTGALNQFSVVDILGDTAFIDHAGIRSFNAVKQLNVEGNNAPFSYKISKMLDGITQVDPCSIAFDNYGVFGVNTIYGQVMLWYDTLNQQWSHIDLFPNIGQIKQFADVKTSTDHKLFFITTNNELYEYGGSSSISVCKFYPREWVSNMPKNDLRAKMLKCVFNNIVTTGDVQTTLFVDRQEISNIQKSLSPYSLPVNTSSEIPFGPSAERNTQKLSFEFNKSTIGWKFGYLISWDSDASLTYLFSQAIQNSFQNSFKQQAIESSAYLSGLVEPDEILFALTADGGDASIAQQEVVNAIKLARPDFVVNIGDVNYPAGDISTLSANVLVPWREYIEQNKIFFALGNHDLDTLDGKAYLENLHMPNNGRYYDKRWNDNLHLFVQNTGWRTDGMLREPDGNTELSIQGKYLTNIAETSTARWKFSFGHHPPYTSGNYFPGYNDLRWNYPKYFNAHFSGHSHAYERFNINGFTYITVGTGGHGLVPLAHVQPGSVRGIDNVYGYMLVRVRKFEAVLSYYSTSGQLLDQFVLRV